MIRSRMTARWSGGSASIAARTRASAICRSASSWHVAAGPGRRRRAARRGAASTGRRPRWRSASTSRRWAIVNVHARNSRSPPAKPGRSADDLQEDLAGDVLGLGRAVRAQVADDLRRELRVDPRPRPLGARASGREDVVELVARPHDRASSTTRRRDRDDVRMTTRHLTTAAAGRDGPAGGRGRGIREDLRRPGRARLEPRSAPTRRRRSPSSCRTALRSTTTGARTRRAAAGATPTASRSRARRTAAPTSASSPRSPPSAAGRRASGAPCALRGGRTGYFKPLTCGGSCSPPLIQWRSRGNLYEIQAKIPDSSDAAAQRRLVAAANSAIGAGPR